MNNIKTAQAIADGIKAGREDFGRVYMKRDGPYTLLNYTPEAMYSGTMTKIEKTCRGLVVRDDGKIIALPMPKFFNLGEPQCPTLPDEPYTVWEKIDGSLGIFWHDGQKWRCNTRGSFDNEYVQFAQEWWGDRVDWKGFPSYWTVMVEICMDDDINPRATHFTEGLYLIAIRDRYSGTDYDLVEPESYPVGLFYPTRTISDIDALLKRQAETEGQEGWVIRYDSGFRVKIKTAWYLRMFRAIVALTPKNIRQLMLDAGENWIDEFPDDLRPEAAVIQHDIEQQLEAVLKDIYRAYSKVAGMEPRKEYALAVLKDYPKIAGWLFALRDGKFDEVEVLRKLNLPS